MDIKKLFVISDIHSNYPALSKVLEEIPNDATVICAGDITGYYTEPNEVCDLLRAKKVLCIVGNHDLYVLNKLPYNKNNEEKYRIQWTREHLSAENKKWLGTLPNSLKFEIASSNNELFFKEIFIYHGSPTSAEEYIYPDNDVFPFKLPDESLLILGHTHHPMVRQIGRSYVLNPGSVGQPRDRNPASSYANVDFEHKKICIHRVKYDVAQYKKKLATYGIIPSMQNILSRTSSNEYCAT